MQKQLYNKVRRAEDLQYNIKELSNKSQVTKSGK
jgi:hypothetical protein